MDGIFKGADTATSSPNTQNALGNIYTLLEPFNRNKVTLTRDTQIAEDLEVDSVAIFDVIMDVEDNYDVTFPMEAISEIRTIGELADTIETLRHA